MRKWLRLATLPLFALSVSPASAHHSYSMFDRSKELILAGTVKEYHFTNPHSWLTIVVRDASGKDATWILEGGSVSQLARNGWTSTSMKPGDRVTAKVYRTKDGSNKGEFHGVITADGKTLGFTPRY